MQRLPKTTQLNLTIDPSSVFPHDENARQLHPDRREIDPAMDVAAESIRSNSTESTVDVARGCLGSRLLFESAKPHLSCALSRLNV